MSENSEIFKNKNEENEIHVSKSLLQTKIDYYVDKMFNKELKRIYILSSDEIEEEAVMISIDEYEYLEKRSREFARYKEDQQMPTEDMFSEIKENMKREGF